MLLLLLAKRKPCSTILPFFSANHNPVLPCSFFSVSAITQNPHPHCPNFSISDYLIASFGFSPDKAARISIPIAHLKSPDKPDAVCHYLNQEGFSQADIKKFITWRPQILRSSPETTLDPNLRALRGMGLSSSTLTQLILSHPDTLLISSNLPRVKFWRDFFGGDEVALVKAFKNNSGIGGHDITRVISPKISLLHSHGLTIEDIRKILLTVRQFITRSTPLIEDLLNRTNKMGFQTESGMFVSALLAVSWTSREAFQKKMKLLESFGWSENEFHIALQKCPTFITLSMENLRTKMDLLVGEVKCEPSYIARVPVILKYSLDKRLRPRQHVLHLLQSKGLFCKRHISTAMNLSHSQFVEKYILPHEKEISGLQEAYLSACA